MENNASPISTSSSSGASIARAIESLQRLTDAFATRRDQLARSVGLTEAQWRVIEDISTEHFMPSMFARRRDCSHAAVSKTLRQLLDRELIRVAIGTRDARHREYSLTAAGKRVVGRLRKERAKAIDQVWKHLPKSELARFAAFGEELAASLEAYAEGQR